MAAVNRISAVWRPLARCMSDDVARVKNRKRAATTLALPHRGGFDADEPDIKLTTVVEQAPTLLRQQCQLVAKELKERLWPQQRIFESTPEHGSVHVQWKFDRQETLDSFIVTSDSARQMGFSDVAFVLTDSRTALFQGNLSTRVPKDGQAFRAGYAAISTKLLLKSFNRVKTYKLWSLFTHLVLKVRGDGRTYLLNLGNPGYFDVVSQDVYNYPLYTHGGPYWQYAKIPFSKFYLSTHARIQDRQAPVIGRRGQLYKDNDVKYFGITICDRVDGPFSLEIDWIGVQYDVDHFEEFAYEMFEYPINLD